MKKNIILAALVAAFSLNSLADDYNYLTVSYNTSKESISLPIIQKIHFTDESVVVTTTDGTEYTYPLSEMKKMTFTGDDQTDAINAIPEQAKGLKFNNGTLKVNGNGMLHIYNANGVLIQMANVKNGANINLESLPIGLYIINMGDKTIKVTK